jgi:hypothetical protein
MSVKFSKSTFKSLFPGAKTDKNDTGLEYKVEDSKYRVYYPKVTADNVLYVKLDHIRADATDDHVDLYVEFNSNGSIKQITYSWEKGNDGYQISDKVIKAVDITFEVAGALGALETAGISEELALDAKEAFDFCAKAFNDISAVVVKWNDDGGRMYFVAVVCHTINRLCSSISVN